MTTLTRELNNPYSPLYQWFESKQLEGGNRLIKNHNKQTNSLTHKLDPEENLDVFEVCAIKLVEHKSKSGLLLENPYWRYGIRCLDRTKELIWLEEWELVRKDIARGEFEVF